MNRTLYCSPLALALITSMLATPVASHACATANLVDGAFGNRAIRVANRCNTVIRYTACIATDRQWPANQATARGFVNPGQTGEAPLSVPADAPVVDVNWAYCLGSHCSLAPASCG